MRKVHSLLLVPALLVLISCKGTGQPSGPFHEFIFNVDSTMLGKLLTLDGMQLSLPGIAIEAPAEVMASLRQAADGDTSQFAIVPERVFYDTLGSVLIFSEFRHHEGKSRDFVGFANGYLEMMRARPNATALTQEWLMLGGIPAIQMNTLDSVRVQFTYVLDVERPMHLAISVPRSAWPQVVHAVESMLGTLKKYR